MKRKIVLATLLCVAVATLGIGVAPALAAAGCTCHTDDPPTAAAAHAPLVVGVDCATCHASWTVPHPTADPRLQLILNGRSAESGYQLGGRLGLSIVFKAGGNLFLGHPGVGVYLQQRLWGAVDFTDLTQVTTGSKGGFAFTVASPSPFAAYRAVAPGHVVTVAGGRTLLFKPKATPLLPAPDLTIAIDGLDHGGLLPPDVRLGRTLTVSGTVAPADLGGRVAIRVQKRVQRWWVEYVTVKRAISATGTYAWKPTPKSRGTYRMYAAIPATAAHRGVVVRWSIINLYRTFRVY